MGPQFSVARSLCQTRSRAHMDEKVKRPSKVSDLLEKAANGGRSREDQALIDTMQAEIARLRKARAPGKIKVKRGKAAKHLTRVIVPDSHGNHIDPGASSTFLADLAQIAPDEIVMLGDHLDAGGTFSTHQRSYTNELVESYADDCDATNAFLDAIQHAAPSARIEYIEGNHEQHIERWAAREFHSHRDAELAVTLLGPVGRLRLRERSINYYRRSEFYDGLSIPGTIRRGRVFFTHGVSHSKHADAVHLERFGASVVFGHVHRSISVVSRTVTSDGHGAWCPGTLAKLQPLYRHTHPTSWSHGYGVEFVNLSTGTFLHLNVPILDGESMLRVVTSLGAR